MWCVAWINVSMWAVHAIVNMHTECNVLPSPFCSWVQPGSASLRHRTFRPGRWENFRGSRCLETQVAGRACRLRHDSVIYITMDRSGRIDSSLSCRKPWHASTLWASRYAWRLVIARWHYD